MPLGTWSMRALVGDFDAVAMALVGIHGAGAIDAGEPLGEERVGVARGEAEVAFSNGDGELGIVGIEDLFEADEFLFDPGGHFHQFVPGALGFLLIFEAVEHRVFAYGALAHHVEGDVVEMFAGAVGKAAGPRFAFDCAGAVIAPAD